MLGVLLRRSATLYLTQIRSRTAARSAQHASCPSSHVELRTHRSPPQPPMFQARSQQGLLRQQAHSAQGAGAPSIRCGALRSSPLQPRPSTPCTPYNTRPTTRRSNSTRCHAGNSLQERQERQARSEANGTNGAGPSPSNSRGSVDTEVVVAEPPRERSAQVSLFVWGLD